MNENQFGQAILKGVKDNHHLSKWYERNLAHQGFDRTVEKIAWGLCQRDGLSLEEAITLSLFIGLSTKLVQDAKEMSQTARVTFPEEPD